MKLIIANHVDHLITKLSKDDRIFSQRVFWFAKNHDIIILHCEPDKSYLEYVTSLTGVNPNTLKIFVPQKNKYNGRHFDLDGLSDNYFMEQVSKYVEEVESIMALWVSPPIVNFVRRLGIADKLQGAEFFSQNGSELVNNKAYFRVFASTANIPISQGEVCYSPEDALQTIIEKLKKSNAVMIKQVHSGAGVGNELLIKDSDLKIDHVGAMQVYYLKSSSPDEINKYISERWEWASCQGKRAVVIEDFIEDSDTIYAEFFAEDSGVRHTGSGRLGYTQRRLVEEIAPLRNIPNEIERNLITYGERLAKLYHLIGYRGYMSADAVVNKNGDLVFTEMNARISGSLHIYDSIAQRVVNANIQPKRTVIQFHSPIHWKPVNFSYFKSLLIEKSIAYDPVERKGVIISFPVITDIGGYISFCIVYENEQEVTKIMDILETSLGKENI